MDVNLVDFSQNALGNIVKAARGCFGNRPKKNASYDEDVKLVQALIRQDHTPIEFGWVMFEVKGISRACADQLTRYRLASFAVQSQRYTDISTNAFKHPFKALEIAGEGVLAMEKTQREFYGILVKNGVPKEDARAYIGMGFVTDLCFACNFRELRHILHQRLDKHAQAEIRELALKILEICRDKWPWLVADLEG